jgi:hypothetical protein
MQDRAKSARDTMVAGATVQRTPRVGIVLSSYKGGGDHFGNAKFEGLANPCAPGDDLTPAQIADMTRHAIRLGNHPNRGLRRVIGGSDLVLLLVSRYAEPVVVSTVAEVVKQESPSGRIMILSDDPKRFSGGEPIETASADSIRMPAPGVWSRRDVEYRIPKAVLDCDRLITIAPLRIENGRPHLTLDNYRTLLSADGRVQGGPDVIAMDLFGFHPAEYAVLGGTHVLRDGGRARHNLVLAGPIATAVDAVGAAVLGSKPEQVPLLQLAGKRGFGDPNLDVVWTIGNEIEEARLTS